MGKKGGRRRRGRTKARGFSSVKLPQFDVVAYTGPTDSLTDRWGPARCVECLTAGPRDREVHGAGGAQLGGEMRW